ncbi:MAG: outer membrane lipoprotein carrier protein LolA [Deferrisomatales bacterium]|nr:outer membrane lipoprotein carrier protein LolA [Deferrisomatales bacterium]
MRIWKGVRCGALAAALAVSAHPAGAAESPQALLAGTREALGPVTELRAHFEQTSLLVASGLDTRAGGTVELARGGRMRWTYVGDDPQQIVSDGVTLWFYQVRDRTVLRRDLAELPPASRLALDVLGGFAGIEEQFALGTCGERCLELTPRAPQPDLARLRIELGADGLVESIATEDALGNHTRVAFSALELHPGLGVERFQFSPPEGVEVLDMEAPR